MTYKQAQQSARNNGMTIGKVSTGAIRVNFKGGPESHAYYTCSLTDTLDAAQVMHENKRRGLKHYWVI